MKTLRMFPLICAVLILIVMSLQADASEDIQSISKQLQSQDWQVRLDAVEKLKPDNEEAIGMLLDVVSTRSEYWPVKIKAILLLGESGDPRAKALLLTIFNNSFQNWECPSIKSYTAMALGNFKGDKKVIDTLINGIQDQEVLTREACLRSLGKIGDPRAVEHVAGALSDDSAAVRLSAIDALEWIGDPSGIPYLQKLAKTENDEIVQKRIHMALRKFDQGKNKIEP